MAISSGIDSDRDDRSSAAPLKVDDVDWPHLTRRDPMSGQAGWWTAKAGARASLKMRSGKGSASAVASTAS